MEDSNKLKETKLYIDKIINGIDPVTDTEISQRTLFDNRIIECFRYISNILNKKIIESERKNRKNPVYITSKQRLALKPLERSCKVSEIANEINIVIAENNTQKISAVWINDWLEDSGFLQKNSCILYGIIDAANALKSSADIMILTSTSVGFNSPKSKNYSMCCEIIEILESKGCKISISVCKNKGYELSKTVNSFYLNKFN